MGKRTLARAAALILALSAALAGCRPQAETPGTDGYAPPEEARLVIYTSHKEEVWRPIVKEFEERTGIWVTVVDGGTMGLLERLDQEKDAPVADVMFGGGVESLGAYERCFAPYTCGEAEAIDPKFRSPDGLWTPFSSLPVVLVYNTKLMAPGEVTGWADLLGGRLRGRIAFADPAESGSSFTALATMILALGGSGEDTLAAFAGNLGGVQAAGSGDVVAAVADGSAWVGVTLEETALKRMDAGDDIGLVYPAEGTVSIPDGGALVAGAPHEENAKRFLDFIAGADVQDLVAGKLRRRSVRTDTDSTGLPALGELALVDYDLDWAIRERESILTSWAAYLGGEEGEP